MPSPAVLARTFLFTLFATLASALGCVAQTSHPNQTPSGPAFPNGSRSAPDDNPALARMQEQVAKGRNEDRQKRLEQDTVRLYELASQLKDEVGKTDQHTLSIQVIRKAEEIEKLAKSVKDRMRG